MIPLIPFVDLTLAELIQTIGYLGMFIIVFLESGVPIGFFLPGDTLLFTAGLLASQQVLNIVSLIGVVVIAAILGDSVGYWFGKKYGINLFKNEKSLFLNKKNLARTEAFYEKYGKSAIILARFVPVVRTFVPIFAGVGSMHYVTFLRYNVVGAFIWGAGVTLLGYTLGSFIPDIDRYLLPIVFAILFFSFLPILTGYLKHRKEG